MRAGDDPPKREAAKVDSRLSGDLTVDQARHVDLLKKVLTASIYDESGKPELKRIDWTGVYWQV